MEKNNETICFDKLENVSAELAGIRQLVGLTLNDYFDDIPSEKVECTYKFENAKILFNTTLELIWHLEKDIETFIDNNPKFD